MLQNQEGRSMHRGFFKVSFYIFKVFLSILADILRRSPETKGEEHYDTASKDIRSSCKPFSFCRHCSVCEEQKVKGEYSWLWLLAGFIVFVLVVWFDLLVQLTALIGAVTPTTTLFIFSIIFLVFVSLHFAIKVSQLSDQLKNLAQKVSLMEVCVCNSEAKSKNDCL
jgi:hypothetical protein